MVGERNVRFSRMEAGAYAALRTPQLSPSVKFFTYPLASDPTTAVDIEAFDDIAAKLPTLGDHDLREFGLTGCKDKPCWRAGRPLSP